MNEDQQIRQRVEDMQRCFPGLSHGEAVHHAVMGTEPERHEPPDAKTVARWRVSEVIDRLSKGIDGIEYPHEILSHSIEGLSDALEKSYEESAILRERIASLHMQMEQMHREARSAKMSEHTLGPWHWLDDTFNYGLVKLISENGSQVLHTYGSPGLDAFGKSPEARSNARLISAAPDLLEACRELIKGRANEGLAHTVHPSGRFCTVCGLNSAEKVHSKYCPVAKAESAIAKAEGREP